MQKEATTIERNYPPLSFYVFAESKQKSLQSMRAHSGGFKST